MLLVSLPPRGFAELLHQHPATSDCLIAQCQTPSNAIDKVKEGVVDALICRFVSRMQARALLEQLAELQSDVCVIFLGRDLGASEVAYLLQRGAFDYLTLPLDIDRAVEAVGQGLRNRDAFIDVRNFSSSLAKANEILAGERHLPKQWNRSLAALNRLTQALSGSLESEAVIRTLFNKLPSVIPAEFAGVMRTRPDHVWTWSKTPDHYGLEKRLRAALSRKLDDRDQTPPGIVSPAGCGLSPDPAPTRRRCNRSLFDPLSWKAALASISRSRSGRRHSEPFLSPDRNRKCSPSRNCSFWPPSATGLLRPIRRCMRPNPKGAIV